MSPEGQIVREGWLQKAPQPSKIASVLRVFRTNWKKRYFILSSGAIPGQCRLQWYTDENKRRICGSVNLDECSQVDSYLTYEASRDRTYQWIFDVQLARKQIFLVAADEAEMNGWVHDLCVVCNLIREEEESSGGTLVPDDIHTAIPHEAVNRLMNDRNVNEYEESDPDPHLVQMVFGQPNNNINNGHTPVQTPNGNLAPYQMPNPTKKGYEKLQDFISAPPRPRQASAGAQSSAAKVRDRLQEEKLIQANLVIPSNYRTPSALPASIVHNRNESSDSNASSVHLSVDSDNSSGMSREDSNQRTVYGLDTVPPPPRPPKSHHVTANYQNAADAGVQLPAGYDSPASNPQNVFGSLPRPPKTSMRSLTDKMEYGGSLPRMKSTSVAVPNKNGVATYEPLGELISPTRSFVTTPGSAPADSYQNLVFEPVIPSPPKVDRTTKPERMKRENSDILESPTEALDTFVPPLPPKPGQPKDHLKITKRDSFVRRERNYMQQSAPPSQNKVAVPKLLPRNGPVNNKPKTSTQSDLVNNTESENVQSPSLSDTPSVGGLRPNVAQKLQYVDLDAKPSPSPTPPQQHKGETGYVDIDKQATQAVKVMDRHRTLERDKKSKK